MRWRLLESRFGRVFAQHDVEAEGLKSADTISGHIKALKASLGELPVTALEKPAEIARFKAEHRRGHEVATVNRALGVLRAAINWGRFQDPPLLATTAFHRFGVSIKAKDETKRDPGRSRETAANRLALARPAPRRRAGSSGTASTSGSSN